MVRYFLFECIFKMNSRKRERDRQRDKEINREKRGRVEWWRLLGRAEGGSE